MLRERKKTHRVPELNTTSTADISFMLLTFFLVTTSMETDRGITQQLPPMPQEKEQAVAEVKRRNVLLVALDGADRITCNGKEVSADRLKAKVMEFVDNESDSKDLPEKVWRDIPLLGRCAVTANHQIFIKADRASTYNAYFAVQQAVMAAYNALRDRLATRRFGHPYAECDDEEQQAVCECYPLRLSEGDLEVEGGGK